jgi:hypothetical protein
VEATDVPLGPEDQPEPDRERQLRDPDGEAEPERHSDRPRDRRDDSDAWEAEATFGENAVGDPGGSVEEDGVDPIVHRGE